MNPSGYSGTPLAKKLGIKSGFTIKLIDQPEYYLSLFSDFPKDISIKNKAKKDLDLIHCFVKSKKELEKILPGLKKEIVPNGMIWISWPKKTSKVETDITENMIRDLALKAELVDVKVCAVDETWSGLKLVIR
jgi:hypothetical protein